MEDTVTMWQVRAIQAGRGEGYEQGWIKLQIPKSREQKTDEPLEPCVCVSFKLKYAGVIVLFKKKEK